MRGGSGYTRTECGERDFQYFFSPEKNIPNQQSSIVQCSDRYFDESTIRDNCVSFMFSIVQIKKPEFTAPRPDHLLLWLARFPHPLSDCATIPEKLHWHFLPKKRKNPYYTFTKCLVFLPILMLYISPLILPQLWRAVCFKIQKRCISWKVMILSRSMMIMCGCRLIYVKCAHLIKVCSS